MMPSPSGAIEGQPSFGSGGNPSSFSLGQWSASPRIPSPSGSVDLQPSVGSGGRPSSFSFRHLSVPSSTMPSPSLSTGLAGSGGGTLGSGGRQPTDSHMGAATSTTITQPTSLCVGRNHRDKRVSIVDHYQIHRAVEQSTTSPSAVVIVGA